MQSRKCVVKTIARKAQPNNIVLRRRFIGITQSFFKIGGFLFILKRLFNTLPRKRTARVGINRVAITQHNMRLHIVTQQNIASPINTNNGLRLFSQCRQRIWCNTSTANQ